MFWSDQLVSDIEKVFPEKKKFIVRDEKTPSGRVHIGSLRGVVIHAIIAQTLREKGYDANFHYELNDSDPMDGLPGSLSKEFQKYMGRPLKDVPPPDASGEPDEAAFCKNPENNFANFYADEFMGVIKRLGFNPAFYKNSDLYREGKYDKWIDIVLEKPDEIRKVYKEVSGSEKREEWNPVQIVCENCGRVGTTTVVSSSGEAGSKKVVYECEPHKVKWAVGCGHKGETSPYKGRGKLPWKVEWAAKWAIWPVDIEGAGKDHSAAGGSHEVSQKISREILGKEPPFYFPYEFFLFGGAKMSSSKGLGASAKEVSSTIPPELLRFLMVRTWPNQTIDFDPSGQTMLRLYDRHDEAAEAYFNRSKLENVNLDDLKRAYHFSQPDPKNVPDRFFPRFSRVAFILQIPSLDFLKEIEKLKGAPLTDADIKEANERKEYAKIWLEKYADENSLFTVQEDLPEKAKSLSSEQKEFLGDIAGLLEQKEWEGEALHSAIHDLRKKSTLDAKTAFGAIYIALLGKDSGPQAGWFLEALDKKFVIKRFREV
jgi:lysyl-tRNA synthetase, class I